MTGKKNTNVAQPTSPQRPDRSIYKSRPIENPPWILWRVWSRNIQEELTQHIDEDHRYLSALYIAKMFYNGLNANAWGPPFNRKGSSFHILEVKEIHRLDVRGDAKADLDAIPLKCADISSTDKWSVIAFKDLAEVLFDTLEAGDYLVIWGGRVHLESRTITLNLGSNMQSFPKTFIAAYRHRESQPPENGHKQFHIPFNSRDVHNSFSFIKKNDLEDSVVQKICPLVVPMPIATVDPSEEHEEVVNHTPNDMHDDNDGNLNGSNTTRKRLSDKSEGKVNSTNSLSKSSVSREVQIDPDDEVMELEEETFSSNSNSTPNRNESKGSNTKHSTSNRSEVAVAPLTRKNILLHTKSQSDLSTSKESNYGVEKFVSEKSGVNVTSPSDGRRPSRLRKSNPQAVMNKSQSSAESPKVSQELQPRSVRDPSGSPEQLSQDVLIELDSQYFALKDVSPENSRNHNSQPVPSQLSPTRVEPGMSQYSTGRMLMDLDNKNSQDLLGDEDEWGSCVSGSTVERVPSIVSTLQLSELKKIRVFHLKCKIHRVHVDQKENIAFLRVTDGTIPPFCPKQLFPNIISPRKIPNHAALIMATLEVDILMRNYDKLANGLNTQSEEVLLTYVTVEKDESRTAFFTMDGNRSTIQEIVEKPNGNTTNTHVDTNDSEVSKVSSSSIEPVPVRKRRKIDTSESSSTSSGSLYDPDEECIPPSPSKKNEISKAESPFKKKKPSATSKKSKEMISSTSNNINVEHEEEKMKEAVVKVGRLNMDGLKEGQTVILSQFYGKNSSQSSNKSSNPSKLSNNSQDLDPQPSTSSKHRQRLRTRTKSGTSPQEKTSPGGRDRVTRNKSRHLNVIEIDLSDSHSETNSDASGGKNSSKMHNGSSKGTKRKLRKSE